MDLFQFAAQYPQRAGSGFKERTTSREAGAQMARAGAAALRERVFQAIRASGAAGLTADQAASAVGATVLAVRPRVTELFKLGQIERTGARGKNESGMSAACWRAK